MTKEYTLLFSKITETINELEKLKEMLKNAQIEAENLYIENEKA